LTGGAILRESENRLGAGAELVAGRTLRLRAGYLVPFGKTELRSFSNLTAGLGLAYRTLDLDYTFLPLGDLGQVHRIQLTLRLGEGGTPAGLAPSEKSQQSTGNHAGRDAVPLDIEAVYGEAARMYAANDYEAAAERSRRVLATDPRHWRAWAILGNCEYMKGRRDDSLAAYEKSLEINPDQPELIAWVEKVKSEGVPEPAKPAGQR